MLFPMAATCVAEINSRLSENTVGWGLTEKSVYQYLLEFH